MEINVQSQLHSKSYNPSSSLSYPHNLSADSKIVSREFNDIDVCAKALKPSNLKIANQLTPGGFQCTITQAQLPGVQFTHVTQNQTVQVKGAKPTHVFSFTMIFPSLETSSTALCVGFQEIFGLSPMTYLKIQRLNGVRRALKRADPKITTVMQVAQQWGFWSLNHFARDYQKMFGELP